MLLLVKLILGRSSRRKLAIFWLISIAAVSYLTVCLLKEDGYIRANLKIKDLVARKSMFTNTERLITESNSELKIREAETLQFQVIPLEAPTNTSPPTLKSPVSQQGSFGSSEEIMKYRWERFNRSENRPKTHGPGEFGAKVSLTNEENALAEKLFEKEFFNVIASDKMALDRSLPDTRPTGCRNFTYPNSLPKASVVIVFCNEAPSALLRTVHSIVNRTPPQYLHEVILVDDSSDRPELKDLQRTVDNTWPDGIVRLFRSQERLGLIRAKMMGADAASGEVLVFLDAHCEVTKQWIEPMLERIAADRTAVVCPVIDIIDAKGLSYTAGVSSVGGFTWGLHFTWRQAPQSNAIAMSLKTPLRSPTMPGGLFAVNREFYYEIGAYDSGMDVWGGENLEISFRTWMCGGSLEFIHCSHVGHIFRPGHPYTFPGRKDTHGLNSKRVADVWMDDYKRLFYMFRSDLVGKDAGNISDRLALRQRLNCKSFKWFLDNIYPEKFIIDEDVLAYGQIRNPWSNFCLDTMSGEEKNELKIGVYYCHAVTSNAQLFSLSKENELRKEDVRLHAAMEPGKSVVLRYLCYQPSLCQWKHDRTVGTLVNVGSGLCLDIQLTKTTQMAIVAKCNGSPTQRWQFEHYL